jgi:hypothetical protein
MYCHSCAVRLVNRVPPPATLQWRNNPQWAQAISLSGLHDHTQTHTTLGRTPLDKWSAWRRDLYLTTHNNHKRQTYMGIVCDVTEWN